MLHKYPMSASISLRPQISRKLPSRSRVELPIHPSSFIIQPSSTPRSPQTPSLPEARPRSDRFRCGGRESKFLAAAMANAVRPVNSATRRLPKAACFTFGNPREKAGRIRFSINIRPEECLLAKGYWRE